MIKNHTIKNMNNLNEINEDEVFEKKESKVKPKLKKIFKNKIAIVIIVIVLCVIISAAIELTTGTISGLFTLSQTGNSIGNIINCGYAQEKDGYIYYVSPSEDMQTTQINCAKEGTNESKVIYRGSYDIRALNIVGNKIYFISIANDESNSGDGIDNKIYKMNLDGSNLTIINDNEFTYDSYDMYVVKNHIYYVGTDYNVYKMDLNGGNRQLVVETGTGYLAMNDKYIIYNKDNEDASDYITYIRSLNGKDERAITSSRMSIPIIDGDFIYYMNDKQNFVRIAIAGGEEEQLLEDTIYNINISNGYVYYLNYKDEANEDYTVAVFKMSLDDGEPEMIKELSNYSSFLNVIGDYIYYMDMDDEKAFINLVNVNDFSEIRLHEWNYMDY